MENQENCNCVIEQKKEAFSSSSELNELFSALSKAQGQMDGAKKDSKNPFFKSKYADLHSCWNSIRKPLSDNGLAVIQLPTGSSSEVKVITVLGHISGQWISNRVELLPMKKDPQGIGSAMTYARRYGLMSITGISPEEDDGNAASQRNEKQSTLDAPPEPKRKSEKKEAPRTSSNNEGLLSDKQIKRMFAIANKSYFSNSDVKSYMKDCFKIESTKELTKDQYDEICTFMQNNKQPSNNEYSN